MCLSMVKISSVVCICTETRTLFKVQSFCYKIDVVIQHSTNRINNDKIFIRLALLPKPKDNMKESNLYLNIIQP